MIRQKLSGVDDILKNLTAFNSKFFQEAVNAYTASTLEAVTFSKSLTPVRTGYLRSRTRAEPTKINNKVILTSFSNDTSYGPPVCFGTRYMKARDFMTPAYVYGKQRLDTRLRKISFTL